MATSTPADAVIFEIGETIKSFGGDLASVRVFLGFPEGSFEMPSVSITAALTATDKPKKKNYRETILDTGKIESIFEVESLELAITLDLWTNTKTEREPIEKAIDSLIRGGTPANYGTEQPRSSGLMLTLSRLYDAKIRALLVDKSNQDESGARDGYYRMMYSLTATVPDLVRMEHSPATITTTTTVTTEEI